MPQPRPMPQCEASANKFKQTQISKYKHKQPIELTLHPHPLAEYQLANSLSGNVGLPWATWCREVSAERIASSCACPACHGSGWSLCWRRMAPGLPESPQSTCLKECTMFVSSVAPLHAVLVVLECPACQTLAAKAHSPEWALNHEPWDVCKVCAVELWALNLWGYLRHWLQDWQHILGHLWLIGLLELAHGLELWALELFLGAPGPWALELW